MVAKFILKRLLNSYWNGCYVHTKMVVHFEIVKSYWNECLVYTETVAKFTMTWLLSSSWNGYYSHAETVAKFAVEWLSSYWNSCRIHTKVFRSPFSANQLWSPADEWPCLEMSPTTTLKVFTLDPQPLHLPDLTGTGFKGLAGAWACPLIWQDNSIVALGLHPILIGGWRQDHHEEWN